MINFFIRFADATYQKIRKGSIKYYENVSSAKEIVEVAFYA